MKLKKLLVIILVLCMLLLMTACKDTSNGIETSMNRFVEVEGFSFGIGGMGPVWVVEDTVTGLLYLYKGDTISPFYKDATTVMTRKDLIEQEKNRIGIK